jgi:hypothetical protein
MPDNNKKKPGGLFYNNKTAFVDSTLNANRDKEWVQRLYKRNTPKVVLLGEDRPSTHLMADNGNGYIFPTLVVQPGQKNLTNLGRSAEDYARETNTGIQFKKKAQGDWFAGNNNGNGSYGGYKKGTGILAEFKDGVKDMKIKPRQAPKLNKTREFLSKIDPYQPNNQSFWGEALNDIPHPTKAGQTMNYNQFKDYLKTPEVVTNPAYNDDAKRNAYGQQVFKQAQDRLYKRADSDPENLVLPQSSLAALDKPLEETKHVIRTQPKMFNNTNQSMATNTPTFKKGVKGLKIKKAVNGLQDVAVPEQGSYSNVASSTATLASAGAQFGPWGAAGGALLGLGTGLLQKDKQDSENRIAQNKNADRKLNRQYAGDEMTINQADQRFSKGGTVKTKTIEIEGKKTPEIHTDKNFNVKNLGTTPHSQGGDKVVATEGDIVFNTQNSLAKFNKIASAIQEGDHQTLHKEKNKLPEDGSKAQKGLRVKSDPMMEEEEREAKGLPKPAYMKPMKAPAKKVLSSNPKDYNGYTNSDDYYKSYKGKEVTTNGVTGKQATDGSGETYYPNGRKKLANGQMAQANNLPRSPLANLTNYAKAFKGLPGVSNDSDSRNYVTRPDFTVGGGKASNNGRAVNPIINKAITPSPATPRVGSSRHKTTPTKSAIPSLASIKPTVDGLGNPGDGSDLATNKRALGYNLNDLTSSSKSVSSMTADAVADDSTKAGSKFASTAGNIAQFAGVANNIFQGLKNEPKQDESYLNPDKIQYTDRSQGLRRASDQAANAQAANARNLSGGLASNLRSNAAAARTANLDRQGSIDEREQGRADAISAQNTQASNQAKEVNLQRKDNYQNIQMGNRAAKEAFIGQAATDIGQYGMAKQEEGYMRSRDDKANAAQLAGYNSINGRYQHKSNLDGSTYFEADGDNAITKYGTGGGNRRGRKSSTFAKGTKAIKIKSKVK